MKRALTLTAATVGILAGAMTSSFAMGADHITQTALKTGGYSDAVVDQLSSDELSQISSVMNSGENADARRAVRGLINKFTG